MSLANLDFSYITLVRDSDLWAKNGANVVWVGAHSNTDSEYTANSFHLVNGWPSALANLENE